MITGPQVADWIRAHDANKDRSRQRSIGPSGLGTPCTRQLAYYALDIDPVHRQADILPAWVGTQAHVGMAEIIAAVPGWRAEVDCAIPGYNIPAHVDAWHAEQGLVVDWKFVGDASLRHHRSTMSPQYRTQVHLYGFAIESTFGTPVREVGIVLVPRNGPLTGIHVWHEPYDEVVVESALRRWNDVLTATRGLGSAALALIPDNIDANCSWCPWWQPGTGSIDNLGAGCPGAGKTHGVTLPPWEEPSIGDTA